MVKAMVALNTKIREMAAARTEVETAKTALKKNPDDPQANSIVGRYYCFERGDWERGLPCLAKAADGELSALARQETALPPVTADDRAKRGDAWWKLAQSRDPTEKASLLVHAGTWYEQALGGLSGLEKVRIEKRLKEVVAVEPGAGRETAGHDFAGRVGRPCETRQREAGPRQRPLDRYPGRR